MKSESEINNMYNEVVKALKIKSNRHASSTKDIEQLVMMASTLLWVITEE